MTSFKELFQANTFKSPLADASVTVSSTCGHQLFLRINSRDIIINATYTGPVDPWFASLCYLLINQNIDQALSMNLSRWDQAFQADQFYWDLKQEHQDDIFFPALELLKVALDVYQGKEHLYLPASPLVCRCFGVRESDVLHQLQSDPKLTLTALAAKTKAGMGCRSCVPQLQRWLEGADARPVSRYYKQKSRADWILEIDEALKDFPDALPWQMQVESFSAQQVIISYEQDISQARLEEVSGKLQRYLASVVDSDLGFFLRRSRQR
jgi:bacterioferritin-associated ferredoxin